MKSKTLLFLSIATIMAVSTNIQSQDKAQMEKVEKLIDNPSQPKKGREHLYSFIGKEMKYPKQARKAGVEGKVFLEFIVNKKGSIEDAKVINGIGAGCDKEALRAFLLYPDKWTLAKHNGKVVKQIIVLPISFRLGKSTDSKG